MKTTLEHSEGNIYIETTTNLKKQIRVELGSKDSFMPVSSWETAYPLGLIEKILEAKGPKYLCDEIMREESPEYVQYSFRHEILGYVDRVQLKNKRILDFACGGGASTCVLAKMFPDSSIVGVELQSKLLEIASLRQTHYRLTNIEYYLSPNANQLPLDIGTFDFIILSAVYEHLLPSERVSLLPNIWHLLETNGILFICQTPFRYFPIEMHTTNLPLINYFPDSVACWCANSMSRRKVKLTWQTWLRRGIRGTTVRQIIESINDKVDPILMTPTRQGIKSRGDLWFKAVTGRNPSRLRILVIYLIRLLNFVPNVDFLPELSLAIRKVSK